METNKALYSFDVIIPCYNCKKTINKCIKSCLDQNYDLLTIILVDDGSQDFFYKYIKKNYLSSNRIIIIHQQNKGQYLARLAGLKKSKSDYCLFLDSDDELANNSLKVLNDKIFKYHSPDLIVFKSKYMKENKVHLISNPTIKENKYICDNVIDNIFVQNSFQYIWDKCYSQKLIKRFVPNVSFQSSRLGEDTLMVFLLSKNANNVLFINEIIYKYFLNNDSITHHLTWVDYKNCCNIYSFIYNSIYFKNPNSLKASNYWKKYYCVSIENYFVAACLNLKLKDALYELNAFKRDIIFKLFFSRINNSKGIKNLLIYCCIKYRLCIILWIMIKIFGY